MPTYLVQTVIAALATVLSINIIADGTLTMVAPRMTTKMFNKVKAVFRLVENHLPLC
jgi:hypothetical protein